MAMLHRQAKVILMMLPMTVMIRHRPALPTTPRHQMPPLAPVTAAKAADVNVVGDDEGDAAAMKVAPAQWVIKAPPAAPDHKDKAYRWL